jgi:hypothetical protein
MVAISAFILFPFRLMQFCSAYIYNALELY